MERVLIMVGKLSNEVLEQAWLQAKSLKLDLDFISILEREIKIRELPITMYSKNKWRDAI
jgi:hypothetical protein